MTHYFSEISSFGAQKTTEVGGGWKGVGVRMMIDGSGPTNSTVQNNGGSMNQGSRKLKAQARKKPKRGAKSSGGREPGPGRKSDSSQENLRNYFSL